MTADHWGYVLAAYALAALAFGGYWRRLARRERELRSIIGTRNDRAGRSHHPPGTGHPRSEAGTRHSLQ